MKKVTKIAVATFLMVSILFLLTGCSDGEKVEIIQRDTGAKEVGSHYLFRTCDAMEYLKFLENFDAKRYEIVDISTSLYSYETSAEFYIVTYKSIQ